MLAQNVPQSDINRRNSSSDNRTAFEILTAVQDLMDILNAPGVLADKKLAVVVEHASDRQFPPCGAGFANTIKASISLDLHDDLRPNPNRRSKVFNLCNSHAMPLVKSQTLAPAGRAAYHRMLVQESKPAIGPTNAGNP